MKNIAILLVLAVAAIVAPAATYLAVNAHGQHRQAANHHAHLQRQKHALHEYGQEVAEYGHFAERVERFINTAREAGVSEEGWNRHHVDVQGRVVSFAELSQFVADADSGENYYFLPSRLKIETGAGGGAGKLFGRSASPNRSNDVRVSLAGDFMVPVQ